MSEVPLPGGFVNEVVRVGDTVRRASGSMFSRRLLEHLRDWPGAPDYLGLDERGREVLSFVPGHVAWEPVQPPSVVSDASLAAVARLVRELHDHTAGTRLAGRHEVVCHNDLSPKNTVYRDAGAGLRPVAFIDWDNAAPGERIHDVAHVCWQFLHLGADRSAGLPESARSGAMREARFPQTTRSGVAESARRLRVICDAYELRARDALVETILWWQERCWRGIAERAEVGDPAMVALRERGTVEAIQAQYAWVAAHRDQLQAGAVE